MATVSIAVFSTFPAQAGDGSLDRVKSRGELLWGSDAEGGAPYVFIDTNNPSRLIGFEVEIADSIAREMGVKAKQVQNGWESLLPALSRGDFDMVMNGIEITPERQSEYLFSKPYYVYTEQLVVRADEKRIRSVSDLTGLKAGTLSGTVAQNILQSLNDVDIRVYTGQAEPYEDLALGRLDAVLLDLPIAVYYAKPNPKLRFCGDPVGEGYYGIAMRKNADDLSTAVNGILKKLWDSGELRAIYERWGMWTASQDRLSLRFSNLKEPPQSLASAKKSPLINFLPALLKGALITICISVAGMALAITFGLGIALARVYGGPVSSRLATAYVEVYRGTPLLIQLYILYYGLPNVGISLSPLVAAIVGLGMNYAAYEAEIYRAGLQAVPKGQIEAAVSLGMPMSLALRRIVLPQALKISLPAITNDFIALFKDSSLVSVIAMVELTKTYNMLAASTLRFFELGLIVAILYFGMSYPLSILARRLEEKLKGAKR
jgi:polar amino acid transport system substrate-binding protein